MIKCVLSYHLDDSSDEEDGYEESSKDGLKE